MNYFDFYNKGTRHWSIKDVRDYFKDNNLKPGQESFKILRLILSKKKINKSDKKFLIDLGFFLEQDEPKLNYPNSNPHEKFVALSEEEHQKRMETLIELRKKIDSKKSLIEKQIISDAELMSMTRDELAASWKEQRICIIYGNFPKRYRWTDSYDDFIKLKNKFDKMMQLHVDEAYSIHLLEDCLTYGYSNHTAHNTMSYLKGKYKTKYQLNKKMTTETFVKAFRVVFSDHKIDKHIAGAILEAFDVGLTYSTCFAYLKKK